MNDLSCAFIENPEDKPTVDHIDKNSKLNAKNTSGVKGVIWRNKKDN